MRTPRPLHFRGTALIRWVGTSISAKAMRRELKAALGGKSFSGKDFTLITRLGVRVLIIPRRNK